MAEVITIRGCCKYQITRDGSLGEAPLYNYTVFRNAEHEPQQRHRGGGQKAQVSLWTPALEEVKESLSFAFPPPLSNVSPQQEVRRNKRNKLLLGAAHFCKQLALTPQL